MSQLKKLYMVLLCISIAFGVSKQFKWASRSSAEMFQPASDADAEFIGLRKYISLYYPEAKTASYLVPGLITTELNDAKSFRHKKIQYTLSPMIIYNVPTDAHIYLIQESWQNPEIRISETRPEWA